MIDLSRQREPQEEATERPALKYGTISDFIADEHASYMAEVDPQTAFAKELHGMLVQAVFPAEHNFSVDCRLRFPKGPKGSSKSEIRELIRDLLFWLITMTPEDGKTLINIRFIWS